jgi:hypothetical protein
MPPSVLVRVGNADREVAGVDDEDGVGSARRAVRCMTMLPLQSAAQRPSDSVSCQIGVL